MARMSTRGWSPVFLIAAVCLIPGFAQEAKAPDQNGQMVTLSVAEMKRQIVSCKPHEISRGLLPKGTVVPIRVSVDTKGKIIGLGPAERCPVGCGLLAEPIISIKKCKFALLTVNGHDVAYSGNVELIAP
jgi:hypothetical protein